MVRKTTETNALALISASECLSTLSSVTGQVRNLEASLSTVAAIRCLLTRDRDLAEHAVVPETAELVADDGEFARVGRRQGDHVVVAGQHLEIQVDRLDRHAVLHIER